MIKTKEDGESAGYDKRGVSDEENERLVKEYGGGGVCLPSQDSRDISQQKERSGSGTAKRWWLDY